MTPEPSDRQKPANSGARRRAAPCSRAPRGQEAGHDADHNSAWPNVPGSKGGSPAPGSAGNDASQAPCSRDPEPQQDARHRCTDLSGRPTQRGRWPPRQHFARDTAVRHHPRGEDFDVTAGSTSCHATSRSVGASPMGDRRRAGQGTALATGGLCLLSKQADNCTPQPGGRAGRGVQQGPPSSGRARRAAAHDHRVQSVVTGELRSARTPAGGPGSARNRRSGHFREYRDELPEGAAGSRRVTQRPPRREDGGAATPSSAISRLKVYPRPSSLRRPQRGARGPQATRRSPARPFQSATSKRVPPTMNFQCMTTSMIVKVAMPNTWREPKEPPRCAGGRRGPSQPGHQDFSRDSEGLWLTATVSRSPTARARAASTIVCKRPFAKSSRRSRRPGLRRRADPFECLARGQDPPW